MYPEAASIMATSNITEVPRSATTQAQHQTATTATGGRYQHQLQSNLQEPHMRHLSYEFSQVRAPSNGSRETSSHKQELPRVKKNCDHGNCKATQPLSYPGNPGRRPAAATHVCVTDNAYGRGCPSMEDTSEHQDLA